MTAREIPIVYSRSSGVPVCGALTANHHHESVGSCPEEPKTTKSVKVSSDIRSDTSSASRS